MLGHIGPKCRGLKGVRYEEPIVKAFEDWLRKNPHLKVAVHNCKEEKELFCVFILTVLLIISTFLRI